MNNPYDKMGGQPSEVVFGGKTLWTVLILFLGGILSFPVASHLGEFRKPKEERWFPIVEFWKHPNQKSYNQLFEKKSKSSLITREEPNVRDHLQSFEEGIKDSSLQKRVRESDQWILSGLFGAGSRKVVRGKNGWLYYRAAIDAVTGRGPLEVEPDSVTKDPDRPEWHDPLSTITTFAGQLKERGVDLMIVPIPVKPMIQPEALGVRGIVKHPDQDRFYEILRKRGIAVVDLFPAFVAAKTKGDVFLHHDTHWRADIAKIAAEVTAGEIKKLDWYAKTPKFPPPRIKTVSRSAIGDLVEMLALPKGREGFSPESQTLERVLDPETGQALNGDLASPISLLGDSFINIYEEPGLGFGSDEEPGLTGAGFGSHLSADLEMRPHIIAINGEGATGVRQLFASLPDNVVRSRKLVIWAIASRDFLLSETAANNAGVYWRDVEFNPESEEISESPSKAPAESEFLILSGTLKQKSAIPNPNTTAYSEAIYSTVFDHLKLESGEYYDEEAFVFLWAFKERKLLPTAKLEIGKRYRLKLIHLTKQPEVARKTQLDDFTRFDIDAFFAVDVNLLP